MQYVAWSFMLRTADSVQRKIYGQLFKLLSWKPQVDLRSGVQRLYEWYVAERDRAKDMRTL